MILVMTIMLMSLLWGLPEGFKVLGVFNRAPLEPRPNRTCIKVPAPAETQNCGLPPLNPKPVDAVDPKSPSRKGVCPKLPVSLSLTGFYKGYGAFCRD